MENFQDTVGRDFIIAKAGGNLQASVLRESNFFFAKNITGAAGNFPILRQSEKFLDGVRNIDSAELPKGEGLCLKGLQLRGAFDVVTATTESDAVYKSVATGAPGDLLNATLRIRVGSDVIVEEKVEDLLAEVATEGLGGQIYFPLKNWKYIPGGRTIDAQLIVPEGETVEATSTNKHFIKVKFVGTAAKLS